MAGLLGGARASKQAARSAFEAIILGSAAAQLLSLWRASFWPAFPRPRLTTRSRPAGRVDGPLERAKWLERQSRSAPGQIQWIPLSLPLSLLLYSALLRLPLFLLLLRAGRGQFAAQPSADVLKAFTNIATSPNYDVHASIVTSLQFDSTSRTWTIGSAPVYTLPDPNPSVYSELFSIPNITSGTSTSIQNICTPLMTVVDCLGFRFMAIGMYYVIIITPITQRWTMSSKLSPSFDAHRRQN